MISEAVNQISMDPRKGMTQAICQWAVRRLFFLVSAAASGALIFFGWALVYTHFHLGPMPPVVLPAPAPRALPIAPPAPQEELPLASSPLMAQLSAPIDGNLAVDSSFTTIDRFALEIDRASMSKNLKLSASVPVNSFSRFPNLPSIPVFGQNNVQIGQMEFVYYGATGIPAGAVVGLACSSCEKRNVLIPLQDVSWGYVHSEYLPPNYTFNQTNDSFGLRKNRMMAYSTSWSDTGSSADQLRFYGAYGVSAYGVFVPQTIADLNRLPTFRVDGNFYP